MDFDFGPIDKDREEVEVEMELFTVEFKVDLEEEGDWADNASVGSVASGTAESFTLMLLLLACS